jgi:hypothetical protein
VAAPRRLPSSSELRRLVEQGLTHSQIAEHVSSASGVTVSRSTVSAALSRAGLTTAAMRYKQELPWRVRPDHLAQYPARMLRLLGRRRQNIELTEDEENRLDAWLDGIEEKQLVVAYAPDNGGFIYVDADEINDGERDIPIRRRLIESDEFKE